MESETPVVRVTLRLPEVLAERLYASRGRESLNTEIVNRLARSYLSENGGLAEPGVTRTEPQPRAHSDARPGSASPSPVREPTPAKPPVQFVPAEVAAAIPGVQVGVKDLALKEKVRRITEGAAKGMCVHRVSLEMYCKKCANGEAA